MWRRAAEVRGVRCETLFVTSPSDVFPALHLYVGSEEARFNVVNAGIDGEEASLETGCEAMIDSIFRKWCLRIILASVLSPLALGPVGLSALELAKRLLLTRGH